MERLVMSETEIQDACKSLGDRITKDLWSDEKVPLVLGVLKGAMNFCMDLTKHIHVPIYMDYIQISSYNGCNSTGEIKLVKDLKFDVAGRTVLIVEDVVDTGHSMSYLIKHIEECYHPKRVLVCALFDKINARKADVKVNYAGRILEDNDFLIGYGLDYREFDRNIPYVYIPTKEEIEHFDELSKK